LNYSGLRSVGIMVFFYSCRISIPTIDVPTITIFSPAQYPLAAPLCPVSNHEPGTTARLGESSRGSTTLLITEQDEIGAAADAKLVEQIGDVKFHGSLGNIESVPNLFVGQILEQ
jgi:hypothetical protein